MVARFSAVSLALAAVSACASSPAPRPAVAAAPAQARALTPGELAADLCPLRVPNAKLTTEDVEDGSALAFTTTGDVADLRRRVRNLADIHGNYRQDLAAISVTPTLPPADHFVEDVPGGARIVFKPAAGDANALASFRGQVAAEADRLSTGRCPIAMPVALNAPPAGTTPAGNALATR